ncbi:MAG: hypothetical protein ACYS9X_00275 [Planctomycetota bacterium]
MKPALRALACALLLAELSAAEGVRVIEDFETDAALRLFESKTKSPALSGRHVTSGRRSMRVAVGDYLVTWRLEGNWKGYDSLDVDMFNDSAAPVAGYVLVADRAWREKDGGTYWNRHNGAFTLKPGANTFSLPVSGLYRGEAGSRNNDIKRNIDPDSIIRLDLGFKGEAGHVYLDNMRLVRGSRPEGIIAFDFGPESQVLAPGFTAVTWNTVHSGGRSFGWHPRRKPWGKSAARDDTFPTRLYQDFVESRGSEFVIDLPAGRYRAWLVYDDLGYWGGEQAKHRRRAVRAEGRVGWEEDRGEAGPREFLHLFEDVELAPGGDPWEAYVAKLFEPVRFEVEVTDGALNLGFEADAGWSSRVAALVVYPDARRKECEQWLAEVIAKQRKEFLDKAVERPAPASGSDDALPPDVKRKGYAVWPVDVSQDVFVTAVPEPGKLGREMKIAAARGEYETASFALRAFRDLGAAKVTVEPLRGPGGARIAAEHIDIRWVWHCAKRGFNSIDYVIRPWSLRPMLPDGIDLPAGATRQFWITVRVPERAPAGTYTGRVRVRGGSVREMLRLELTVRSFALDEPEFPTGFFGSRPPGVYRGHERERVQADIFKTLREHGMTQVAGPPGIALKGFEGGKPVLDFGEVDTYMRLARDAGFAEVNGYGGMRVRGLHSGYEVGEAGARWSRELGVPFVEVCRRVFDEVRRHAEKERWLPFDYPMCDETRVREVSERQLVLMRALREAAPWLRTAGSYSVSFKMDRDPLLHQEFFKTLRISYLNSHDPTVMAKARETGAEVRIYNQGRTRYSFGWYQWSEAEKGVGGRTQWHLLALHGYQWFDLDGREPDTAMVNYGREGVVPTIHLARCREGTDDFRYCRTLANLVARAERKGGRALVVARKVGAFLRETTARIALNDRRKPDWLDEDAMRERLAGAIADIRAALGGR